MENEPKQQYPVRRVCSWCKKDMGEADFTSPEPGGITHTICQECKEKFKANAQKEREQ